jgi:putative hydrolase of the HAD superfamily
MIISAEEGLRKPQKEIYTKTLTKLNVRDCCTVLFIDDTDENVKAAEEAGMHGILFTDTDQTIADMRQHYNIIA